MSTLSRLFDPERVAVIGATDRPDSVGRALVENLAAFDGEVALVNPNRERVFGEPCYPTIDAVVETVQRVSQLVTDFPAITELDVNPLVVSPDGVCAIDLRLTVDADRLSG